MHDVDERLPYAQTHNGLEIGGIISGEGYFYCNGTDYPLQKNDLFFVDATLPHNVYASPRTIIRTVWVALPLRATTSLFPTFADGRIREPFVAIRTGLAPVLHKQASLVQLLHSIYTLYKKRPVNWDLQVWAKALPLLVSIVQAVQPKITNHAKTSALSEFRTIAPAIQYIDISFTKQFSISDIARKCNLSESRFSHLFSQIMGIAPIQYRNQLRINKALEELQCSDKPIKTICYDCGFQSISHFRTLFSKYTGTTPQCAREKKQA